VPQETATVESQGRRERKKAETRRAIRDAALERALELGVEHLTVTEITEAVDISPRTFFNYFGCKEDALVADGTVLADQLRERARARPLDEVPLDTLRAVLTESDSMIAAESGREQTLARQRLIQAHPSLAARQLAQFAVIERTFVEVLAERMGVDAGEDLRPAVLAALAQGVLRAAMGRWSADGSEPLVTVISRAFDLLHEGVLTDPPG